MINRLNNSGPVGLLTVIHLKQAQIRYWEPSNILYNQVPFTIKSKGNFSIQTLKNANKLGITILSFKWADIF